MGILKKINLKLNLHKVYQWNYLPKNIISSLSTILNKVILTCLQTLSRNYNIFFREVMNLDSGLIPGFESLFIPWIYSWILFTPLPLLLLIALGLWHGHLGFPLQLPPGPRLTLNLLIIYNQSTVSQRYSFPRY